MKAILTIFVLIALAKVVFGSPFSLCSSTAGKADVASLHLQGADCNDKVCKIHSDETVIFRANFTAKRPSKVLKITAKAYWGIFPFSLPLDHEDACGNYGPTCPLIPGKIYELKVPIKIPYVPSGFGVTVTATLADEEGDYVGCANIYVKTD